MSAAYRKGQSKRTGKMIANYHTHTYRCGHASMEDEREYVEAAIKAGFRELGFADHCPMPIPKDIDVNECSRFLGIRMTLEETEGYVNKLLELRREYEKDIKIHIGFEVEYIPEVFGGFLEFINKFPIDYIILGQHFNSVRSDEIIYFGTETKSTEVLKKYVDLAIEALGTGRFSYIAHPDLCNFTGQREEYRSEMIRLIRASKQYDTPLEINLLGISAKRNYPDPDFWSMANDEGCNVIIGSDAHASSGMKPEMALARAEEILASNPELKLIERLNFKPLK